VTRGKGDHDPIRVEFSKWGHSFVPSRPDLAVEADIAEWLLNLWKQPDLTRFFEVQRAREALAPALAQVVEQPVVPVPAAVVPPFSLSAAVANEVLKQNGHHSRVVPDASGNLVPLAEVLPALSGYNKRNKPRG